MQLASVSQAKNSLSALLDQVKAGETVVIVDRGVPVARLEPLPAREVGNARRERLERSGALLCGTGRAADVLGDGPARMAEGQGWAAVAALVAERRDGR